MGNVGRHAVWASAGMAVGAAVALIGTAVAADQASPSPLSGAVAVAPLVVEVEVSRESLPDRVTLTVVPGPARSATARGQGTVTGVRVTVGDTVAGGAVVASVDDREIVTLQAEAPLHRDLSVGDRGADVGRLQDLLLAEGFSDDPPDGVFGAGTRASVDRFLRARGWTDGGTFPRAATTWIGPEPLDIATMDVAIGDLVVEGTPLFSAPVPPTAVEVVEPQSGIEPRPGGLKLAVGDVEVDYEADSLRLTDPVAVAEVARALAPATEGLGTVEARDPPDIKSVPATAVVTDRTGATCVFTDAHGPPVSVSPVGGSIQSVYLPAQTPLDQVLVNPVDVRDDPSCG